MLNDLFRREHLITLLSFLKVMELHLTICPHRRFPIDLVRTTYLTVDPFLSTRFIYLLTLCQSVIPPRTHISTFFPIYLPFYYTLTYQLINRLPSYLTKYLLPTSTHRFTLLSDCRLPTHLHHTCPRSFPVHVYPSPTTFPSFFSVVLSLMISMTLPIPLTLK